MVDHIARRGNDIFGWPLVSALFKNKTALFIVRSIAALLFVSAVWFGLQYPSLADNPYTTAVFWSLFWPFFMIVSIVLVGPGFCGVCPHGVMGRYLARFGMKKAMPAWLKNRGIGLAILIAAYWVPVYLFPGLLKTPWVAAALFLGLTLLAAFAFYRYKDMAYCTYLCPLGSVTKSYGKLGMVRLQTYQGACGECRTFDCAKACETGLQPYLFEKKNSMRPLATMRDGWVHLFSLFGYIGAVWSAVILYRRLGMYGVSFMKKAAAFAVSGAMIWFYTGLLILQVAARSHH